MPVVYPRPALYPKFFADVAEGGAFMDLAVLEADEYIEDEELAGGEDGAGH